MERAGWSDDGGVGRARAGLVAAGAPLVEAETGEGARGEEVGGARMHAQVAGAGEYRAGKEADGVGRAREIRS
ncbi:hypothetical protein B1218_36680, partial [Pseudomonas ogarae]